MNENKRRFVDGELVHDLLRHETIVYKHARDKHMAADGSLRAATAREKEEYERGYRPAPRRPPLVRARMVRARKQP